MLQKDIEECIVYTFCMEFFFFWHTCRIKLKRYTIILNGRTQCKRRRECKKDEKGKKRDLQMQTPLSLSLLRCIWLLCVFRVRRSKSVEEGGSTLTSSSSSSSRIPHVYVTKVHQLQASREEKRENLYYRMRFICGGERERESKRKKTQTTKKQRSTKYQRGRARIVLASNYIQMYNVVTV